MATEVKTEAPQYDEGLLNAVESQLRNHNLRLKPDQSLETVLADLKTAGLELAVEFGTLTGKVGEQTANIPQCFENFAKKNEAKFYPRDVTGVTARDQMDREGKQKFIHEHGIEKFE